MLYRISQIAAGLYCIFCVVGCVVLASQIQFPELCCVVDQVGAFLALYTGLIIKCILAAAAAAWLFYDAKRSNNYVLLILGLVFFVALIASV